MGTRARAFNYLLRPSKQVERKLILQCLHRLRDAAYPIPTYRYLGFGSIYYADFLLFHRYLYMNDMLCVESANLAKSMKFNAPFDFVQVEMKPVAEILPRLDRERRHVVWLDYDYGLVETVLVDLAGFMNTLAPGSVLIATVKASPPEPQLEGEDDACRDQRHANVIERISRDLGGLAPAITQGDLTRQKFAHVLAGVISEHLAKEADRRADGVRFNQLFSYRYADGVQMLTIGGLVDKPSDAQPALDLVSGWSFARTDPSGEPLEISVPSLTVRERHWLDQRINQVLTRGTIAFDLEKDELESVQRFYREYPSYFESII